MSHTILAGLALTALVLALGALALAALVMRQSAAAVADLRTHTRHRDVTELRDLVEQLTDWANAADDQITALTERYQADEDHAVRNTDWTPDDGPPPTTHMPAQPPAPGPRP